MQVHTASGVQRETAVENTVPSKLAKSAQEFEAILLQAWLEKMNHGFAGSPESQDAAHDTISSLGTQAVATALAARGGIGIASMLVRQLQSHVEGSPEKGHTVERPREGLM